MNKKDKIRDLIRTIKCDPIEEAFNSLLVKIYINAPLTYIISGVTEEEFNFKKESQNFIIPKGAVVEQIYDKKTQKLIDKITKSRDEYHSLRYGEKEKG